MRGTGVHAAQCSWRGRGLCWAAPALRKSPGQSEMQRRGKGSTELSRAEQGTYLSWGGRDPLGATLYTLEIGTPTGYLVHAWLYKHHSTL